MRCTYLLLTCLLVISQVQASFTGIPGGVMSSVFSNEVEIEAKDIIVNVGKVEVEIEKEEKKGLKIANVIDTTITPRTSIKKEIDIAVKDIIVNIGKVKVEIEKDDHYDSSYTTPTYKPTYKPTHKPIYSTTTDSAETVHNITSPLFEDFTPSYEPTADEVVLGENATAAITVQGGEHSEKDGVLILTGPQIFSVTFKIVKEKVITMTGQDLNIAGGMINNHKQREAVTFIIRGRGFVAGGGLFNDISDIVDGTSKGGLFDFLEPRVFLGAIPLKVVRFTDTTILARFLDFEDQRSFEPGTLLARVKVLHVELKKEKKKHGPGEDIGILGEHDDSTTVVASVGGLVLPALGAIGGSITSGPVLGVIGIDGNDKHDDGSGINTLLGLFSGLRFDTAVLAVQFSEKDAQKIRGSFNTLFSDDTLWL